MEQFEKSKRRWAKKKKYKICCPKCGHRMFRGNFFDIDLNCSECGTPIDIELEGSTVFMIFDLNSLEVE